MTCRHTHRNRVLCSGADSDVDTLTQRFVASRGRDGQAWWQIHILHAHICGRWHDTVRQYHEVLRAGVHSSRRLACCVVVLRVECMVCLCMTELRSTLSGTRALRCCWGTVACAESDLAGACTRPHAGMQCRVGCLRAFVFGVAVACMG